MSTIGSGGSMRLTKQQEVQAVNELLAMLANDRQRCGYGLRTSEMRGTRQFHGMKTLSLTQIARLLRKTGKAVAVLSGSPSYSYNLWTLTEEAWDQACNNRYDFFSAEGCSLGEKACQGLNQSRGNRQHIGGTNMKGPMKLIDESSGLMECRICGSRHFASLQSGYLRADGVTRYYRGSWQCSNEQCPSNQKEWDGGKQRFVKPDWRRLAKAVTV
jgi:hypothetical protein